MPDYQVGNLAVDLITIDANTEKSLDKVARRLSLLYRTMQKFTTLNTKDVSKGLSKTVDAISGALRHISVANIEKLSNLSKSANHIQRFVTVIEKSNSKNVYGKLTSLLRGLSSAVNTFDDATLIKLERIANASKSLQTLASATNKINSKGKGDNWFKGLASLTISVYTARRLGRYLGSIVQSGADYTETLNLWETAMGKNVELANEFVNKMNEAYGISEKTLMNAQAIFKNMLGSLGQISESTAYVLSEAVTQMAVDYASLYNVQFEKAFQKFQAALAGQVRPIRSVSGYDITENTLYQLYQSLGGTKSVKNLSRTEKQLLSILAIFNQMTASGAVGDLKKTMESFANQSRVMAESWAQVKTYAGIVLSYTIEQMGVLKFINAVLMFMGDALKFYADTVGAITSFGGDPFANIEDSATSAQEAIQELSGSLLDFDKFRALSQSEESISIDDVLLSALSNYNSILLNATNEARKLADEWLGMLGITRDVNGELSGTETAFKKVRNVLISIAIVAGGILGLSVMATLVKFGKFIYTYAITPLSQLLGMQTRVTLLQKAILGLSTAFFAISLTKFITTEMSAGKRIVTIFMAIAGAITAAAIAMNIFKMNWAGALSAAAIVAGGVFAVSSAIPKFANGASDIDSGTVFIAGEMGRTETVYTGSNGKTNVANVQQMQTAFNGALNNWWQNAKHDIPQFREVSKTGIYEVAKGEMQRRGEW